MAKFKKFIVDNVKTVAKRKRSRNPRVKKRALKKMRVKKRSVGKRKQLSMYKKISKMYGEKLKNIKGK